MATSAFKSATKRTPMGSASSTDDCGSSSKAHRRSRSLSRFSRPKPEPPSEGDGPAPRGRFVNTVRGSGFPEISLDDLAIEFFKDSATERESDRGRSARRFSEVSPAGAENASSQRRGRSVSRQSSRIVDGKSSSRHASSGGTVASDANSRRRRSVSVIRYQISDSENSGNHANTKCVNYGSSQMPSFQRPTASSHRRLGRSLSQKDLSKMQDGYSSHSSALTDDDTKDGRFGKNMAEKTIWTVYAQKKAEHTTGDDVNGLYQVMRKELRHAVDEIRTELAMAGKTPALASAKYRQSDKKDARQAVSTIRKTYATKLEQSEKCQQDLLAEIAFEEQRGRESSKIMKELLPDPRSSTAAQKPMRIRKRSNDKNRVSTKLAEEAEKYLEDFISNVEDTDISSFDGERSDTSSTLGAVRTRETSLYSAESENFQSPAGSNSLPVEMEGVILPWLKWETSNDSSPFPSKNKKELPVTPKNRFWDALQGAISAQESSSRSTSSRGSWSPALDTLTSSTRESNRSKKELTCHQWPEFDMERYTELEKEEDLLFERWREQSRLNCGGMLLCSNAFI
ncbi:uncharacterized protein LOC127796061 isoform X2 [Diospyros lotus]|uniref:uncharacterized protein LOC127796061 isoform X2 n=1 Tax=Diospyros lotus TaxID=55363 RepID=UPI00225A87FB|nr:uncharacterized protein LOC127796061 isoform X2 [Diospyros lotus]